MVLELPWLRTVSKNIKDNQGKLKIFYLLRKLIILLKMTKEIFQIESNKDTQIFITFSDYTQTL